MKTNWLVAAFGVLCVSVCVSACMRGVDPAWNSENGATRVALQFASLPASRALSQGEGHVYIRTIGGPTGSSGPFYGPYRIASGSSFSTSEIPPGAYAGVGILFASKPLDDLVGTFNGATLTFREAMSLPDDKFNEYTEGSEGVDSPFNLMLNGYCSGYLLENVEIVEGIVNSFSVTLEPMTSSASDVILSGSGMIVLKPASSSGMEKRYVGLQGLFVPSGSSIKSVDWALQAGGSAVALGLVALYNEDGKLIRSYPEGGSLAAGEIRKYSEANLSASRYYVYLEYSTSDSLMLSAKVFVVEGPGTGNLSVVFNNPSYANQRVFYGLYDAATIGPYGPTGNPVALGLMTLDSMGHGASQPYKLGETVPATLPADTTYAITAFVDANNNYTAITGMSTVGNIDYIVPHYGDLVTIDPIPLSVTGTGGVFAFNQANFEVMGDHVFFVSSTGSSSNSGQLANTALDVTSGFTAASNYSSSTVYLVDDIMLDATTNITAQVQVCSVGFARKRISLGMNGGFSVLSGELTLAGVILDGMSAARSTMSPIQVTTNCVLFNTDIVNCITSTGMGGAVNLSISGAKLMMEGSSITACSAYMGGGIYAVAGSSVYLGAGATVSGNTGMMMGNDGYFLSGVVLTLAGGTISDYYQVP